MFFLSLSLILLIGVVVDLVFEKINIPSLIGLLLLGLGLNQLGLIDESILEISSDLRKIALIIILLKAGLSLDFNILKRVGRPAILMCFVPATFEIIGFAIFGPMILNLSFVESLLIGSVLGAVSPAIVIQRMTNLIDRGIGVKKGIPQMLIAGSSADDIYCIVIFTALAGMLANNDFNALSFIKIPSSIILGIGVGIALGFIFSFLFSKMHVRDSVKLTLLIGVSFLLVFIEDLLNNSVISISSYLAVIAMGLVIFSKKQVVANRLTSKCNKIWIVAEIFLFVLVGASMKIDALANAGLSIAATIIIALLFRMLGTLFCLIKTNLNLKERLFVMLSEIPKATVQAAIGGSLIGMVGINQDYANLVLTVSVLAIIISAPVGALAMDLSYKRLLTNDNI